MMIFVPLALALAAAHAVAAPVAAIKAQYQESIKNDEKSRLLAALSAGTPRSAQDIAALFDLFSRFPDSRVRAAVMECLSRMPPDSPALEPLFVSYLKQPEPEARIFGINGALRLRAPAALPLIREIAESKFKAADVSETLVLTERNAWWTQYEALSALAQWEKEKAHALVRRKAEESPAVGRLLGRWYWAKTLPELKAWSSSPETGPRERARQAYTAPIDPADARATHAEMMALLRDKSVERSLRHALALKIGGTSTDEEAAALVAEHDAEKDPEERLYWAAAAFASRSPRVVELLVRYAKEGAEPRLREGARLQLEDMLGPEGAAARLQTP
jgi:hypothetical protein